MNFISLIVVLLTLCALVASALDPIPADTKDKLNGDWFDAAYTEFGDPTGGVVYCVKTTTEVKKKDALSIKTVQTNVNTEQKSNFVFFGARVDNGSTKNYQWMQDSNDFPESYDNYTLLGVTKTFSVFYHVKHIEGAAEDYKTLFVFSKDKTLSPNDKDAIKKIEKNNKIDIDLEPDQNRKCKDET